MNTCDKCAYYTQPNSYEPKGYEYDGKCALMAYGAPILINRAIPWDYEGYSAGVHVGPKFGCINWEAQEK